MAVFTCKMCGAALEISGMRSVTDCKHCGTRQTLPKLNSERKEMLYRRANLLRRKNEYDQAQMCYEQILKEDRSDPEAYWSLVLCRYGIEYVKDPSSTKRIPAINRTQFTPIFDDENYKSALSHADLLQREVYRAEAKAIDEIQSGILAICRKEEPFDVFISYKETDESRQRTRDSVLANELYYALTAEGFKVFFARITLEDKLGGAYEPYIFAALNTAKVMVVLGTKPEYFNAVWVKNEWSRYLSLIYKGEKKTLIPAYRDMDAYDLPSEFSHLQSQDMSKLGFMQDLIRGIKKIIEPEKAKEGGPRGKKAEIATFLKRVQIFLENREWDNADLYCEKILDMDPENADAYVCKLLAQMQIQSLNQLASCDTPPENFPAYRTALRFADAKTAERLASHNRKVKEAHARVKQHQSKHESLVATLNVAKIDRDTLYGKRTQLTQRIRKKEQAVEYSKEIRQKATLLLIFGVIQAITLLFMLAGEVTMSPLVYLASIIGCIVCLYQLRNARKKAGTFTPSDNRKKTLLVAIFVMLSFFAFAFYCPVHAYTSLKTAKKELSPDSLNQLEYMNTQLREIDLRIEKTERAIQTAEQRLMTYR